MDGLTLFSLVANIWLIYKLVRKTDDCNLYRQQASYWLEKYNEK